MTLRSELETRIASAVDQALKDGLYRTYLTSTSECLKERIAECCGVSNGQLFSSATAGLETLLRTVVKNSADHIVLSGYDYPGNFWAVERAGARPLLIDTAERGWCIDPHVLEQAVASEHSVKAVVASHLHGEAPDLSRLREICDEHGILLIEDACQAFGAELDDGVGNIRRAGSIGHAGLVSFGGGKVISAGRGGAVVTDDDRIAQRVAVASGAGSGPYAISELQAAVVLAQLPMLDRINDAVSDYFKRVSEGLSEKAVQAALWCDSHSESSTQQDLAAPRLQLAKRAFYQVGFLVNGAEHLNEAVEKLSAMGIKCGGGFPGFHRRSARRCSKFGELSNATAASERTLTIHYSAALGELPAEEMAAAISSVF